MLKRINKLLFIGIIFIILGVVLIATLFMNNKIDEKKEQEQIYDFINHEKIKDNLQIKEDTQESKNNYNINYLMVIDIPKIKLKRGIYDINSKFNNLNYGIKILKESTMPDTNNSNVILASHSGNSSVSYFDKLDQLTGGDYVYLYHNGIKYIYQIVKKYEQNKTGVISLYKEQNVSSITLITCSKKEKTKQIVLVGNKVGEENY